MSDEREVPEHHHHPLRERLDAARTAAEEVVSQEGGQLGGEVDALAVPFEEIGAAVRAALHPEVIAGKDEPDVLPPEETPKTPQDEPSSG